jgi:hypothetical protein
VVCYLFIFLSLLTPMIFWLIVLTGISYWRYAERRHKSNEQAYRHVLVLDSLGKLQKEESKGE